MLNILNCAEQLQIQKYKTHLHKTPKTSNIQLGSKNGFLNKSTYPENAKIVSMLT